MKTAETMKIFIGNLGNEITADQLYALFSAFGTVTKAIVPGDSNGSPRGFGYIVMPVAAEAERAIRALNKKAFMQQFLSVSEAICNAPHVR